MMTKTKTRGRKPTFGGKRTAMLGPIAIPSVTLTKFKRWAKKNNVRLNYAANVAIENFLAGN